jgi:hypothetical protein
MSIAIPKSSLYLPVLARRPLMRVVHRVREFRRATERTQGRYVPNLDFFGAPREFTHSRIEAVNFTHTRIGDRFYLAYTDYANSEPRVALHTAGWRAVKPAVPSPT